MIRNAIRKLRDEDKGFTLIELMVVVLIIGILIAIALPTFLGARERAQNRAAQSDLRNGLAAGKVHFTDGDTYVGFNAAAAELLEPSLDWADLAAAPALGETGIITALTSSTVVQLAAVSASGRFYCVRDNTAAGGGTTYGAGAAYADVDGAADCLIPNGFPA